MRRTATLATCLALGATAAHAEEGEAYAPMLNLGLGKWKLEAPATLAVRGEAASEYTLDRDGTKLSPAALNPAARIGLSVDATDALLPFLFAAELELELLSGPVLGRTELAGVGLPDGGEQVYPGNVDFERLLRKAYARVSMMEYLHLLGGVMPSHWGLGLVANDGAITWAPGQTRFSDSRGGDVVYRAALASGPHTRRHKLFFSAGFDVVAHDDVLLEGDSALQFFAAAMYGRDAPTSFGVYFVRRHQESAERTLNFGAIDRPIPLGAGTVDVNVLDATGRITIPMESRKIVLEAEAALIFGKTTLAPTPDFPEHDVLQFGAAARARYEADGYGAVIDFLFATGDANLDDATQSAFKADVNYDMGLLLYRHLVAGVTGRSPHTASNPDIVGVPPQDVERVATRGQISGTLALFPKGYYRPVKGLEIYGGPLFAFSTAPLIDPFNTRIGGGDPKNALDAAPGRYLGTELDLGIRYQTLIEGTELTIGLEGGALFTGAAFATPTGRLGDIFGGRALLSFRL